MRLLTQIEYESLVLESQSYGDYQKNISDHIKYHIENRLSISESIFRIGSDAYLDMINEMRNLWNSNKIEVSEEDQFILEKLYSGKKGIYKDSKTGKTETVNLDDPQISPNNINTLFYVYRPAPSGEKVDGLPKAIMIGFGEKPGAGKPDVRDKHQDEGKRRGFLARHNCKDKKDPYASGWWSCNIHKWWKQLGLKTDDQW